MFEHKMSRVASKRRSTRQAGENRIVRTLKEILKNLIEIEWKVRLCEFYAIDLPVLQLQNRMESDGKQSFHMIAP